MFYEYESGDHSSKEALKYIIPGLTKDQPRHGYEIIRILEDRTRLLFT